MNSSVAALTLFLVAAALLQAQAQPGARGDCCQGHTDRHIPLKRLVSYEIRTNCPLPAIVFFTKRGIQVCADPHQLWTKERMSHLPQNGEQRTP